MLRTEEERKMDDTGILMMTLDEAAEYVDLSRTTIYRYVRNGSIPVYRVSGRWRFYQTELDEWKKNNSLFCEEENWLSRETEKDEQSWNIASETLMNSGLLTDVPSDDVKQLMENIRYQVIRFSKNSLLIRRNQKMNGFLILYEGCVRKPAGSSQIHICPDSYWRDRIFGLDIGFTERQTSYFNLYAETDGIVVKYPFDFFEETEIESGSRLYKNLVRYISEENIRQYKKLECFQTDSLGARLLVYLWQKEENAGGQPVTMDTYAVTSKYLNMSVSSLSTQMNRLKNRGIIRREGKKIWIHHKNAEKYLEQERKK